MPEPEILVEIHGIRNRRGHYLSTVFDREVWFEPQPFEHFCELIHAKFFLPDGSTDLRMGDYSEGRPANLYKCIERVKEPINKYTSISLAGRMLVEKVKQKRGHYAIAAAPHEIVIYRTFTRLPRSFFTWSKVYNDLCSILK